MERLKDALEALDETIFDLEHKVGLVKADARETAKRQDEIFRQLRTREANAVTAAQKIAARLDQAIANVEQIIR